MGFRDLENAIERGVDGVLGRVFRGKLDAAEITKRVERELDARTKKRSGGSRVMPNKVSVQLNPRNHADLEHELATLTENLTSVVREHARTRGCTFEGPVKADITSEPSVTIGTIAIAAAIESSETGSPPGTLIYPDGYRFDLSAVGASGIILGRDKDSGIVLADDLASRQHAVIKPSGATGWFVEDLRSTNGTRVNGQRVTVKLLADGDSVTVGATVFQFQAF